MGNNELGHKRNPKAKSKKKPKKKLLITVGVIFGIIILVGASAFGYVYTKLGRLKNNDFDFSKDELGVKNSQSYKKNVENILLLGVDMEEDASDVMMVLSLDKKNKTIKLTSLMRDMYVYYGEGMRNKLNYAYHYGGPQNSIKVINEQFDLNIENYVKVDMYGLYQAIDTMGGVDITVKDYEIGALNSLADSMAMKIGLPNPQDITRSGTQRLNGLQAVGYARIRAVGNQDYERTGRARNIITGMAAKASGVPITSLPTLIDDLSLAVDTSLSPLDMVDLGIKGLSMDLNNIQELRVPDDRYKRDTEPGGWYIMEWDREPNLEILHKFIFGEYKPSTK